MIMETGQMVEDPEKFREKLENLFGHPSKPEPVPLEKVISSSVR